MKTVFKSESIQDFESYFSNLSEVEDRITLWQVDSETEERLVVKTIFTGFDIKNDVLNFKNNALDI